jgi:hypothetical protein
MTPAPAKPPNALLDIALTVIAPSLVLDYLSPPERLGPFWALVISMFFPVAFGLWCWWKKHAWDVISIFGFVTILISGGLGLLKLDAVWFSVKESAMPLALGAVFPLSHAWGRPLINALVLQPHLINLRTLNAALDAPGKKAAFDHAIWRASWGIGLGMIGSSVANFFLALHLLAGKEPGGEAFVRGIGTLNWASLIVIGVPMMAVMLLVFLALVRRIQQITGLERADLMNPGRTVRRQVNPSE